MPSLIYRKGLDLKNAVASVLAENYHSDIVNRLKASDFTYRTGRLTIHRLNRTELRQRRS